jgi:hypothetical protein
VTEVELSLENISDLSEPEDAVFVWLNGGGLFIGIGIGCFVVISADVEGGLDDDEDERGRKSWNWVDEMPDLSIEEDVSGRSSVSYRRLRC